MPTVAPDCGTSGPGLLGQAARLPGYPWTFRLAGPRSGRPALELYEAGNLIDVVSSTRIAASHLRGARAVARESGELAIAWGRVPETGTCPQVRFVERGWRRGIRAATVVQVTTWCWVAVADGSFAAVTVRGPEGLLRLRMVRSRP